MWRVTPKGYKEAKNIFNVKKGLDLGFDSNDSEKREVGFEYFEDSVEVEVSQLGDSSQDKDRTFDDSTDSVGLIRKSRPERTGSPKLKPNRENKRSQFNQLVRIA